MTVAHRRGRDGHASGDALPDRRAAGAAAGGRRPVPHRGRAGAVRDGRLPRRPALDARGGGVGSRRTGARASRCGGCSAAGASGCSPTPRARAAGRRRTSARGARVALRDAGVGAIKLRFELGDWRADVDAVAAVRDAVGPGMRDHGGRQPGLADARRPEAALGCGRRRSSAPARSSRSASTGWRSRCARDDIDGYAALRRRTDLRLAAGEMVRQAARGARPVVRGGVDVIQTDVVLAGGIGGCPRVAALADLHGRAWSPHTWSNGYGLVANLHAALAFSTCPYVEVPFDPPDWTAARARLAPARAGRDRRRRHDRARRRGRASASSPTSTRSSVAGGMSGADSRSRGRVARGTDRRSCVEQLLLHPPQADEVLVRVAAAGVCHSDLHLAEGHLGTAAGRSCSATRARASSRRSARASPTSRPGDPVVFCFVPPCGPAAACRAGRSHLCTTAADHAWRGTLLDGTSRLSFRDGRAVQHFNFVSLLRRAVRGPGGRRVPLSRRPAAVAGGAAGLRRGHRRGGGSQRGRCASRRDACA